MPAGSTGQKVVIVTEIKVDFFNVGFGFLRIVCLKLGSQRNLWVFLTLRDFQFLNTIFYHHLLATVIDLMFLKLTCLGRCNPLCCVHTKFIPDRTYTGPLNLWSFIFWRERTTTDIIFKYYIELSFKTLIRKITFSRGKTW